MIEDDSELAIMEIAAVSETEKQAIPSEYHDLIEVFDIERAWSLPPTRGDFNFKIKLKEGAEWPKPSNLIGLLQHRWRKPKCRLPNLRNLG